MKLYAPRYYERFKCIADKCQHNCCTGWEIDIDNSTLKRYKRLKNGYGAIIKDSISFDEAPHFRLDEKERCPHLDENGLCKIITNLGEEYLCDICREHPRFYNFTDVGEVGIGMSCPEAARIILSSSDYMDILQIGEREGNVQEIDFDARTERSKIYKILSDKSCEYEKRLEKIYQAYGICAGGDDFWLEKLAHLEYLNPMHQKAFMKYSSVARPKEKDEYLERFLAYFIYRHVTEALDYDDLVSSLSFCLFCERLFASLMCTCKAETPEALASIISEEIEYSDDNTLTLMYC